MKEEKQFLTESKELLNLMINSIYSNKEIFLRELISNASDALDKYKFLALSSAGKYPLKDYTIRLSYNKDARWIQVQDNGIGMEREDMEKNLGTIARSGTKEFLAKYKEMKDKKGDVDLIGQFGVGFYSAFMVAKKVEVYSRSLTGKENVFSSDGVDTYTIEDQPISFLKDSGTAVRVYLKDDKDGENYSDYLSDYRIEELVKKYSDFIRYPIKMVETKEVPDKDKDGKEIKDKTHKESEDKTLNSMVPLWKKAKKNVSEKDLNEFYKTRFNDYEDPLLSLYIKMEGTLSYNALIYIPSHAPYNLYAQDYEKGLALYAKGIYIAEKNKELIPDYLKFVRGLIDSEDLPLNISREMIQSSPLLKKIANNIEKKILEKLKDLLEHDRAKYEKFFSVYGNFLKFGIYQSYGMKKDALQDLLLYKSMNENQLVTLREYKNKMKEGQKYIYYATGKTEESIRLLPELSRYKKLGFDVLLLSEDIDEFTLMMMRDYDKSEFKNITSENKDDVSKEEKEKLDSLTAENKRILDDLKASLKDKVDEVNLSLDLGDAPVAIQTKEGMSLHMEHVLNEQNPEARNNPDKQVKASKVMVVNPESNLFKAIKGVTDESEIKTLASVLYDEAMLLEGYEVKDKGDFVKNLNTLLEKAYRK